MHHGIDLAALSGTPVQSACDGIVTFAGKRSGYGNCVVINHGNDVYTKYAHLKKILITNGNHVCRHQIIGTVGSTGNTRGKHDPSHLHFEVIINHVAYDPLHYLLWYTS